MAKARKILKRRNAVRSIRTVTKTMEMVSTARFRKSHTYAAASRPYTDRLMRLVGDLVARERQKVQHPLLEAPSEIKREVLLVLTSNRGLCSSYNAGVLRVALERFGQTTQAGYDTRIHVVGKKGVSFLKFRSMEVDRYYTEFGGVPEYAEVGQLAETYMQQFLVGKISGLEVAYTRLVSGSQARPVIAQVLPMSVEAEYRVRSSESDEIRMPYELHPSNEEIVRHLLPAAVRLRLYQCFLDATVTEQMARMAAMRSATENADELIGDLTVQYNRMRQAQITTELTEIIGGRAGLE